MHIPIHIDVYGCIYYIDVYVYANMHLLTYSHHFKECFHYPKELILISSNLILFHVNRKLATATENILQVSLPTVAELNPLSRALIIISQFAALVSEEVMWLPRVARVGVSPALSRATKSKKENTGAPSPLCTNKKEIIMSMKKQQQIDGGERGWRRESQFNEIHARCCVA